MKRLTNLKNFTLALVFTAISVISWGQEPLELKKIADLNEFYLYDGSTVTLSYTVEDENYDDVDEEYYHSIITDKDGNNVLPASLSAKGKYTLTIIGNTTNYTGILTASFYIWDTTLDGAGTELDPYMIDDEDDWIKLSALLYLTNDEADNPTEGKFYKLGDDISVETMVGKFSVPFMGKFDGDKKTLTFNKGSYGKRFDDVYNPYCAPFRYTDGATIHDLVVNGSIYTEVGGAAGLIGWNISKVTEIQDVIVSVNIHNDEDAFYDGGIAAVGSSVSFENCVYNGLLASYSWGGGFTPYGNENTHVNNCIFNPDPNSRSWGENFVSYDDWGDYEDPFAYPENIVDCYYAMQTSISYNWGEELSKQGTKVYVDDVPEGEIGCYLKEIKGFSVYTPVTVSITGVLDEYVYTGSAISITPTVTYNGVSASGHYTVSFMDSYGVIVDEVKEIGDYTMTITANNGYLGSKTKEFSVYSNDYGNWSDLQSMLANNSISTITLDCNYRAESSDATLIINRDVNIELNGYTIDRHLSEATQNGQVLKINSGKTVTITGPGVITGGNNKEASGSKDGGGIYNMGILTLNKVTVSGNKCEKKNPNSTTATGRGGGIYSGNGSTLNINGCVIRENEAQGGAGGIFADQTYSFVVGDYTDSETTIHTSINSNRSLDKGGGIRVRNSTTAIITNCSISNNEVNNMNSSSVANGGGIHLDNGNLTLNNCTIDRNTASKYGGGIYAIAGKITATDCHIDFNQSYDSGMNYEGHGGGVYMYGGTFKMYGGSINENASNIEYGGGIYISSAATFVIKNSDNNSISINGNWTFDEDGKKKITNVYLAGTSIIQIEDNISGSTIGVANNVGESIFTNGLKDNGTSDIFTSDDDVYMIQSYEEGEKLEAKFEIASPWVPTPDDPEVPGVYTINNAVVISDVYEAVGVTIGTNGSVTIVPGGCLNTTSITNTDPTKLIIYGGQLITNSENVQATMKKDITGALALSSEYWYLISSGIDSPNIKENTNLIKLSANNYSEYDLYRFNESVTNNLQWENYRACDTTNEVISPIHDDFAYCDDESYLENGRGYLYRNGNDYTISISGTLNSAAITTPTLTCEGNVLTGFNIIGNPYPHNIKKGDGQAIPNGDLLESNYYVLLEDGRWEPVDDGDEIHVMEGILVQAKTKGALTISKIPVSAPASKGERDIKTSNKIWFTINNDEFRDRACVEFKSGHGLNKINHMNENAPMLYINYNGEDFASVDMSKETKVFDLNFDAKTTGYYTLSMKSDGEFDYIHLIDRLTGDDIDMLQEEEYTFIGSASDNADRFLVKLSPSTGSGTGSEAFAWQNGNDIIVNGNGELLVFDVMGRMVATRHINSVQTINLTQTGVYIFRLEGKTQKIIVR